MSCTYPNPVVKKRDSFHYMVKAFVFGKYLPFHKGHKALIEFALTRCDFLTVVICCSDKENISDGIRKGWLQTEFSQLRNIDIITYHYSESDLPNTSQSSREVSRQWAEVFQQILPDQDLLVTSEPYGYHVAEYMDIVHIPFDMPRTQYPVSATAIRNNLLGNWDYLPDSVKPYYAIKVSILGTESTGKSTLTELLSDHFHCSRVMEAGRDIIPDSNDFSMDDLHLVAREHARRIHSAERGKSPLIILDTDIHITKSYCRFFFNRELEVDSDIHDANRSHLYLYLNNDVDHVQDGTRLDVTARDRLDLSHREVLRQHGIHYVDIKGNWEDRFNMAVIHIHQLLERYQSG